MPSPFYFQGIRDGYAQNGMDEKPLEDALMKCRAEAGAILAQRQPRRGRTNKRRDESR